ncbi:MAG: molybdopterin-dependent oxidoreductase, partial [Dehalococcoidales bacterium]
MPDNRNDMNTSAENNRFSITRRAFLRISAISAVAVAASRLIKYPKPSVATPVDENTEGVVTEKWVPTSCLNCPSRCAIEVRVVNGKAVKIAGNPLSQISEGEICPRGHLGVQVLYDPARVTGPLKRTSSAKGKGIDPGWVAISWNEALSEVSTRLGTLRNQDKPHQLLLFQGLNTISSQDMIQRFAGAYGTPNVVTGDSLESDAEKLGRWLADGNNSHIAYDFGRANYILAFGAGIVESERPLARNLRLWGKIRRERPNRAKVVAIEPRYSVTAAKADRWLPVNHGTEGALAMALAYVIINEGLYDSDFITSWTTGFDEYKELVLGEYSPSRVAAITGIDADTIQEIAREFAQTRPAVAWAGRGVAGWPNGSYSSYAIFCLNALVGGIDVPGGIIYQQDPNYRDMPEITQDSIASAGNARPRIDLSKTKDFPAATGVTNQVADSIMDNSPYPVGMAIGFNSNFNISAPGTVRWDEAMARIPYYVHVAPFISEMAEYADVILPSSSFLEEWGYDHSPPGSGFAELKLKQPAVEPLYDTKSITDIIFDISGRLGGTVASSFIGIGDDAEGFVKYRTGDIVPWDELKEKGVWLGPAYQYGNYDSIFNTPSGRFEFYSANLAGVMEKMGGVEDRLDCLPHYQEVEFLGDEGSYPLTLLTYQPLLNVENGHQNYPWAQE